MALSPVRTPRDLPLDERMLAVLERLERLADASEAGGADVAKRKALCDVLDAMCVDYQARLAWWVRSAEQARAMFGDLAPAEDVDAALPDLGAILAQHAAPEARAAAPAAAAPAGLPPELAQLLASLAKS